MEFVLFLLFLVEIAVLALVHCVAHAGRADLTALAMLALAHAIYHAVSVCWPICYSMAVAFAKHPTVVALATFAVRVFTWLFSTLKALVAIGCRLLMAVSKTLVAFAAQVPLMVLVTTALLIQAIWLCVFHASRYLLTTGAARYIVTTASTAAHKMIMAMGSIAISIPTLNTKNGSVMAWRQAHLRVGIQLTITDIDTPNTQPTRIGVDETRPQLNTIKTQCALVMTKSAVQETTATTTAPTAKTTTTALTLTTDGMLGVHVDASNKSAVGEAARVLVARWMADTIQIVDKPILSRHLAIDFRSFVPPPPPNSSALSLVWHSPVVATPTAALIPLSQQPLASASTALVSLADESLTNEPTEASLKSHDLIQATGSNDASTDDEDTSSSTAEPESESELEVELEIEMAMVIEPAVDATTQPVDEPQVEELQAQEHQDEDDGEREESPVTVHPPAVPTIVSVADVPVPTVILNDAPPPPRRTLPSLTRLRPLRPTTVTPTHVVSSRNTGSSAPRIQPTRPERPRPSVNQPLNYNPKQASRLLDFLSSDKWAKLRAENKKRRASLEPVGGGSASISGRR